MKTIKAPAKLARSKSKNKKSLKLLPEAGFWGFIICACSAAALLIWRLSSATGGNASAQEINTKHMLLIHSPWWKSIKSIYGPYYLLLHGTFALGHSLFALRLSSVICGLLTVVIVYWIAREWHGYKIGLLSAAVILLNFGFLAVSRQATPNVSQLLMLAGLLAAILLIKRENAKYGLPVLAFVCAMAFYVPGGFWFALAAIWLVRKDIYSARLNFSKKQLSAMTAVFFALIAPLGYLLIRDYSNYRLENWLGYGLSGKPHALHSIGVNLINTPLDLFVRSSNLPAGLSLGHMPLLPVTFTLLVALGLYSYITLLRNWRWQSVLLLIAIAWLLSGFGLVTPLAVLPLLALCAGTGTAYLLKQWYVVFPRNPLARSAGILVIFSVILFTGLVAARSYIVAWANDPETLSSYIYRIN